MKFIFLFLFPTYIAGQSINPAFSLSELSYKKTMVVIVENNVMLTLNDEKSSWRWEVFNLSGADYITLRNIFKYPIYIGYLKMKKGRGRKKGLVLVRRKAEWQTIISLRK
jgi:hypothetical protein